MRIQQEENKVSLLKSLILWLGSITVLVFIDQITKYLAVRKLCETGGQILIPGVLELQYVENRGMAFGMLQGWRILFIILCIVFCAALVCFFIKIPKTAYYFPLIAVGAVLAAGATGNFIDRMMYGYVLDFIYFSLIDFPVFNVADIYVVCGGIAVVALMLFRYKDEDFNFLNIKG